MALGKHFKYKDELLNIYANVMIYIAIFLIWIFHVEINE